MNLASVDLVSGAHRAAADGYAVAAELFAQVPGAEIESANCRMNTGLAHLQAGDLTSAEVELEAALAVHAERPDAHLHHLDALGNIATLRESQRRLDDAETALRRCVELCPPGADGAAERASFTVRLASLLVKRGRRAEARDLLVGAFEAYSASQGLGWWDPNVMAPMGIALRAVDLLTESATAFALARTWYAGRAGFERRAADALVNLALVYQQSGQLDRAEQALVTAGEEFARIPRPADVADTAMRLANVRFQAGKLDEALDAMGSAHAPAAEWSHPSQYHEQLVAVTMLAVSSFVHQARYSEAEGILTGLFDLEPPMPDVHAWVCWGNLGNLYLISGRLNAADQAIARAGDILRDLGRPLNPSLIFNRARVLEARARTAPPDEREQLLRRALDLALPQLLKLDDARYTSRSSEWRASSAQQLSASALPLVFHLAEELGDGVVVADLTVVFRSAGLSEVASVRTADASGLSALGMMLVDAATDEASDVLPRGTTEPTIQSHLAPLIGLGDPVARRLPPRLVMPDGRIALARYRGDEEGVRVVYR